jgi:hypothetical protein
VVVVGAVVVVVVVVGATVVVVVVGATVVVVVVGATVVVVAGTVVVVVVVVAGGFVVVVVVGGLVVVVGDVVTVVVGGTVTVTVTGAETAMGIAAVAVGKRPGWRSEATLGRVTFLVVVTFLLFSAASPVRKAENCSRKGIGGDTAAGAVVVVVVGTAPPGSVVWGAAVVVVVGAMADTLAVWWRVANSTVPASPITMAKPRTGHDARPCTRRLRIVHRVSRFRLQRTASHLTVTTTGSWTPCGSVDPVGHFAAGKQYPDKARPTAFGGNPSEPVDPPAPENGPLEGPAERPPAQRP